MKKHTILFMAANPGGTDRLALGREARAIQSELERSGARDCFELKTRWAAKPLDLLRELRKLKPTVVHFSGHGVADVGREHSPGSGPHRDVAKPVAPSGEAQSGLLFHGDGDRGQVVSTAALEQTIEAAGASVQVVVLNACYSEGHAAALLAHVDCVVGMSGSVQDDAARSFAIGFYGGLGERESVEAAFKQGCAAINLEGRRDADRPQLRVRDGVDAGQLVLAAATEIAGPQGEPGHRQRRLLLAAAAVLSLLVMSMILDADIWRTVCQASRVRSLCAAVGIGNVPTPAEQELWAKALAQDSCDGLRAYLRTYPQGVHVDEAKARVEGRWIEAALGPEQEVSPGSLVVPAKGPLPTEEAARHDAQERGDEEAATMCNPPEGERFFQLLAARVEPRDWRCEKDASGSGVRCGFDGKILCRVRNRLKVERCRAKP